MKVVSDASPIIILSAIGLFPLLQTLFQEIHISAAVHHEVVQKGKGRPGTNELQQALDSWVSLHNTPARSKLKRFQALSDLSLADASVIALAQALEADLLLIDDRALRHAAQSQGFIITGVAGILFRAKKADLIPSIAPVLDEAIEQGLRMSKTLKQELLIKAGEFTDQELD